MRGLSDLVFVMPVTRQHLERDLPIYLRKTALGIITSCYEEQVLERPDVKYVDSCRYRASSHASIGEVYSSIRARPSRLDAHHGCNTGGISYLLDRDDTVHQVMSS